MVGFIFSFATAWGACVYSREGVRRMLEFASASPMTIDPDGVSGPSHAYCACETDPDELP